MADLKHFKPRIRPVEAFPIERDGQSWIALHDPTGFSTARVALSPQAFFIVSHFDGNHSVLDIQAAYVRQFGELLFSEQITTLAEHLDKALLLDSERFAEAYKRQVAKFLASDARPYRADTLPEPDELERMVDEILRPADSVRAPAAAARLVGLIAPHLDYGRGKPCYAQAYGLLAAQARAGSRPELTIILGTNHFGSAAGPVACDKDFETPFGRIATDREAVAQLSDLYGRDLLADQFDHLREHSIELQGILLARLYPDRAFKILPLLLQDPSEPDMQAQLDHLAAALARFLQSCAGRALLIAGADLSHVGPRFGDDRPLEEAWLASVAETDREAVDALRSGRTDVFVEQLRRSSNATRICSVGPLYVLRRVLSDATWQDLGYHQACDAAAGTCVTCLAAALWS